MRYLSTLAKLMGILLAFLILMPYAGTAVLAGPPMQATAEAQAQGCPTALNRGSAATAKSGSKPPQVTEGAFVPTNAPALLDLTGCILGVTFSAAGDVPASAPKGWGSAVFVFNIAKKQLCYAIHIGGIKLPATAAHFHYLSGRIAMT